MSTVALTLNKNEVNTIERGVGTITVGTGKLVVVPFGGEPTVVSEGESFDAKDSPVTILALEGTNYGAVYTEPTGTEAPVLPREVPASLVPPEAPRGDSDGESPTGGTGPYEDRTVVELKALAEKRGIDIPSHATKAEIIAALRV
jgi:hypothetical protein